MWEGNGKDILKIFVMGGKWEGIDVFFREEWKKDGKNWAKCPKFGQKWPKIGKNSKFWTILHFSLVVTDFCWYGKEMGRKFCVMLVWEGNIENFWNGREIGRN